ncbi:GQ67_04746T0 [Komagataella phaffii]|nr:GQ67_04746T0 [Komagataella phaffii]AOA69435.1 GQ68_04718T0 [Komagataella phaffii GS115]
MALVLEWGNSLYEVILLFYSSRSKVDMGRSILAVDDLTVNNIGTFAKILDFSRSKNSSNTTFEFTESWVENCLEVKDNCKLGYYDEIAVGLIKTAFINDTTVYIEALSVLPEYLEHGVFEKLVDFAITHAKSNNFQKVSVQTNNPQFESRLIEKGFIKASPDSVENLEARPAETVLTIDI